MDIKEKGTVALYKAIHDISTATFELNRYVTKTYGIVKIKLNKENLKMLILLTFSYIHYFQLRGYGMCGSMLAYILNIYLFMCL